MIVQQHDLSLQVPLLCCIVFVCLFLCNTFLLLSSTVCTDLHLPTGFGESNIAQKHRTAPFLCSSMNSLPVSGNSMEESYSGLLRFDWQLRATPGKVCPDPCVSGGSSRSPQMEQKVLIPSFKMDSENYQEFSFWHLGWEWKHCSLFVPTSVLRTRGKSQGIWRNSFLKNKWLCFLRLQYLSLGFNTLVT